jgi:NTE family protein
VPERRVDLVFEGGGVKGIGLAGAFRELYDSEYRPECVAGTSAGAITASLVAAGYTGEELEQLVLHEMHFPAFADEPPLHLLGVAGEVVDILKDRGLHSGNYFREWIREHLAAKGLTTFGQLHDPDADHPNRAYRLQVIASDLTDHGMLVLPRDANKIGINPDQLAIADAVRMSMSIPIFFDPVIQPGPAGRKHMIVDGGMLSNYPIWLFDASNAQPRFPTFGMLLVAPKQEDPLLPQPPPAEPAHDGMPSLVGYIKAIAETMMQAHDRFYVEQANFVRTIAIPTCGITTTQFNITLEQTQELFDSGRNAANSFLASWDFDKYKAKYRTAPAPGRRQGILD